MNPDKNLSELTKKVQMGLSLGVFKDRLGQKLLRFYHLGILDPWTIGQINTRVDKALRRKAFQTEPVFQEAQLHSGKLILGVDNKHKPLTTHLQYLNAGSLLVANTGSGKTTLLTYYAQQIAQHVKGMWLVDLRKKEFRFLRPLFRQYGMDLVIVRSRSFKINPLQVPLKVAPGEYAATIADVLAKVLNLPPRASVLLSTTIIKLYQQYHVDTGSRKFPTLFHLFEAVRNDKTANSQARQAILDNLEAILISLGPEVLGYYHGWDTNELAKFKLALELTGLPESGKDLLLNTLVASEFTSRIARGISNKGMDLWMSLDEGQRLFSQHKETSTYTGNSLTDLAGLVRGAGIGLFISVLTPDDLSNRIPAITSTKIMGRCGSIPEYMAAGRYMGLSSEQITWCAHHMIPGTFVGQIGDGKWRYPFLFKIPAPQRMCPVSDQQADQSLAALSHLKVEPVEFVQWSARPRIDVSSQQPQASTLTDSEYRLLKAIVDHPMLSSSQYVKLAKISPNTLSKLRPELIQRGFIREHEIDSGKRGRTKRMLEPLEAGIKAVQAHTQQEGI